ncbi:MAG: tryptophan-rich sensory protein [Ignavibacteria bacterium]|nr:tryptophan-rich sensory protein [Ignavibacteria bacterium]
MKIFKFILCIAICEGVGIIAGIATSESVNTWYQSLNKPSFTPPNYIFAPVWSILYLLMGISLYLIWNEGLQRKNVKFTLYFFIFHLLINGLWSFVFFKWHLIFLAFITLLFLWNMILISFILFYRINKLAAFLLLPYLIWVMYASFLNYFIYKIN